MEPLALRIPLAGMSVCIPTYMPAALIQADLVADGPQHSSRMP
jgi:hypothetical protein